MWPYLNNKSELCVCECVCGLFNNNVEKVQKEKSSLLRGLFLIVEGKVSIKTDQKISFRKSCNHEKTCFLGAIFTRVYIAHCMYPTWVSCLSERAQLTKSAWVASVNRNTCDHSIITFDLITKTVITSVLAIIFWWKFQDILMVAKRWCM